MIEIHAKGEDVRKRLIRPCARIRKCPSDQTLDCFGGQRGKIVGHAVHLAGDSVEIGTRNLLDRPAFAQ